MKQFLTFLVAVATTFSLTAQNCSELFISEYVEGYGNNRALELYNPTIQTIDLSEYSVGRFSNGETEFAGVQIPPGNTLEPYGTFVIVLDKRDSLGEGLETPVWNGYQLWDVCIDRVTEEPIIDENGDTVYCVQYDDMGAPLYGDTYHEFLDLEGKADIFVTPIYNENRAFYFNGNDAVALIKGTSVNNDGSNIIDVVGVIGEDPESTIGEPAWVDADGRWLTRDRTLVRSDTVMMGTGPVVAYLADTFAYNQWTVYPKNYFENLGWHKSICDISSVKNITEYAFKIYPNPVTGANIHVESEGFIRQFTISNIMGQQVQLSDANLNQKHLLIGTGTLTPGLYTLRLKFDDNTIGVYKFAVQH